MVEESEKRFEALMNKLFHSPPKSRPSSSNIRHVVQTLSGRKRPRSSSLGRKLAGGVLGESWSSMSCSATSGDAPVCRPWDRHDMFTRLSTFKSMTWFAKPKVVNPLECARRGWVNIDMDTIACASCDARLVFSTPSAWTQQQVEKAALVFSLKLENGHKSLCPWTNNACAEELAQFPVVPRAGLIENYKKRLLALSYLIALPVISPVAIDNMRSSQLEQLLGEPSASEYQEPLENSSSNLYYQALKLISLFGWEPHILPYKVDFKDGQRQSITDANVTVTAAQKTKVNIYALCTSEGTNTYNQLQVDPSSVVLDCDLCGASVGLWAFVTTPQPLEYLRFVGVTEVTGKNITTRDEVGAPEGSSGFTIAGGPPPGMLNYDATISLPLIGPNLRARLSMENETKNHLAIQKQSELEGQPTSIETESTIAEMIEANPLDNTQNKNGEGNEHNKKAMIEAENREQGSICQINCLDNPGGESSAKHKPVPFCIRENKKLPSFCKSMDFDPVQQHRHFCPWIMSTGRYAPGWKQTLSALVGHKELDNVPLSTLFEVDDPVASVKRLFTTSN